MRVLARAVRATAIVALLIPVGCGKKDDARSPTSPTPGTPAGPVHYTAIGASDAIGIGASRLCITLAPCPEGTGYVPLVARQLAATRQVTLSNLGIAGLTRGFVRHGDATVPWPTSSCCVTRAAGPSGSLRNGHIAENR